MSKPRVAVVGIGRLGSFHTKLVNAGGLFDLVLHCRTRRSRSPRGNARI